MPVPKGRRPAESRRLRKLQAELEKEANALLGKADNDADDWENTDDNPRNVDNPPFKVDPPNFILANLDESIKSEEGVKVLKQAGKNTPNKRRVTVVKDTQIVWPEIMFDVYVADESPSEQAAFARMFFRSQCRKASSPEMADLVVFTGSGMGVDVDPQLYGETPHPMTDKPDLERDRREMELYLKCVEAGIPMMGVCRGAQFLAVMNGAKLFQHVDNHQGNHKIVDTVTRQIVEKVSSVHHQMVRPDTRGMEILATCSESRERWLNPLEKEEGPGVDVEAFFFQETGCLGFQGHPEYRGYYGYQLWCLRKIREVFIANPDYSYVNGRRRMKPDLVGQRSLTQYYRVGEMMENQNKPVSA